MDTDHIVITREGIEAALGKGRFTDEQWATFVRYAHRSAMDGLYELGREILAYGRPGQSLSADSAQVDDVILDQNGEGPYTVIDRDQPSWYMRFTFRREDGSEFTDTAAMEATFTVIAGPSYIESV